MRKLPRHFIVATSLVLIATSLVLVAGSAAADPIPPRVRMKEEHLRKLEDERKHANDKPPFQFSAPEGFIVGPPLLLPDSAYPDFYASSAAPAATMTVFVTKGAVVLNDEFLGDKAQNLSGEFTIAHPGGTVKIIAKELVTLDGGAAARITLETRANAAKKTRPMREIHYLVGNATHNAHIVYATSPQSVAKLEKKFDASLRRTSGLAVPAARPAAGPAEVRPTP